MKKRVANSTELHDAPDGTLFLFAGGDLGWKVAGQIATEKDGGVGTFWPWEILPGEFPADRVYPSPDLDVAIDTLKAVANFGLALSNEGHALKDEEEKLPRTAEESNVRQHVRLKTEAGTKIATALRLARIMETELEKRND